MKVILHLIICKIFIFIEFKEVDDTLRPKGTFPQLNHTYGLSVCYGQDTGTQVGELIRVHEPFFSPT